MHIGRKLVHSVFALLAIVAFVPACDKNEEKTEEITPENIEDQGSITEQHDNAQIVWKVDDDGSVYALVKTPDGKPVDKNVHGTLTVTGTNPAFVPVTVPIAPDPKTGMMKAVVPMPDDPMVVMKYDLKVEGKPVTGAMHVPYGGTAALADGAKKVEAKKIPEGKKGPNGGIVQVVGDDVVEIVADKSSGQVRVYVLDNDFKPVKVVSKKKISIGFVSPKGPETVVLVPDAGGAYFVGKMTVVANPTKITVAVIEDDKVDVVLCGYHPGKVIVVGAAAPVFVVLAPVSWGVIVSPVIVVDDHVHWKGKGKGKGKWKFKGKKGGFHVHIH